MADFDPIAQPDVTPPNRAHDVRLDEHDPEQIHVTLEQVDETIMTYLRDVIHPTVVDNDRIIPVPIMYANPERWKTIRKDGYLRDKKNDKMQTPVIIIRRTTVTRNNLSNPSNKYLYITHNTQWNAKNSYDRFSVLNNVRPSQKLHSVIVPDYVDLAYDVVIWTEYQTQMNAVIEQINAENDEYWGSKNNYKFRIRIEDYTSEKDLPAVKERLVRDIFTMKVFAYLIPEKIVRNFNTTATNARTFTAKKIVTLVESDQTGTKNPDGVKTPEEIKRYYDRTKAGG